MTTAHLRAGLARAGERWSRFWFEPESTATLAVVRILFGFVVLEWSISLLPDLSTFFSSRRSATEATRCALAWRMGAVFAVLELRCRGRHICRDCGGRCLPHPWRGHASCECDRVARSACLHAPQSVRVQLRRLVSPSRCLLPCADARGRVVVGDSMASSPERILAVSAAIVVGPQTPSGTGFDRVSERLLGQATVGASLERRHRHVLRPAHRRRYPLPYPGLSHQQRCHQPHDVRDPRG